MRFAPALLATAAALAAAAPAQAADLDLSVTTYGTITMHSTESDGLGNSENVDASVDLEHQLDGLRLEDGQKEASSFFMHQRLFGTSIGADRTMQTNEGPWHWTCKNVGEAYGAAGQVRLRRDAGDLLLDVGIQDGLEGATACVGPTQHGSTFRLMSAPAVAKLRVPESALGDASEVVDVRKLPITCTQGTSCKASFSGSVVLRREDDTPPEEQQAPVDPQQPGQPAPAPGAPGGSDDADPTKPTKPTKPAKPARTKVKATRTKRGAKVTVTCGAGCGGKVSALSVARSKQLATKPFKTQRSTTEVVKLRLPKHTRGGVMINVRATPRGGAPVTRTVRLGR